MRHQNYYINSILLLLIVIQIGCSSSSQSNVSLSSKIDSVSYYTGNYIASEAKMYGIEAINNDLFMAGLKKGFIEKKMTYNKAEVNAFIELKMNVIQENYISLLYSKGLSYLAINKTHKRVSISKTGLQFEKLTIGNGNKSPSKNSKVIINYRGYTIDNKIFQENNYANPDTLLLSETIAGFREGLQLMTEGSKYKLYIPSELAYGPIPPPSTPIKPMMPIIFEVELIKIL